MGAARNLRKAQVEDSRESQQPNSVRIKGLDVKESLGIWTRDFPTAKGPVSLYSEVRGLAPCERSYLKFGGWLGLWYL